jgi:uncharacterized protein (UPF0276 family)
LDRRAGIGLRAPHVAALLESRPALGFVEVHSENYFGAGGPAIAALERVRSEWPVSLHGVGLSLGSADRLDEGHLAKLRRLVERIDPAFVSEHLSWSAFGGRHANDLLPLPFDEETVAHVAARIAHVQEALGRPLMVENVSRYHAFVHSTLGEGEFVAEVVRRSGCRLLLDVNNVWVNAVNHGLDPREYLEALDGDTIGEIHVAGHERAAHGLVDSHAAPVSDEVWTLYAAAIARFGPRPTLVEWDAKLPALPVLLAEAAKADSIAARARHGEATLA